MKYKNYFIAFLVLMAVSLAGCRTSPVLNINESPITPTNKTISADDVRAAIIRAGNSLGWRIKEIAPGKLEATLLLRSHMAKVDITYNEKTYSIKYKDSSNLKYDGTNIHSNYNGWVQNLDTAIQNQLALF